ncbi:MAG: 2-isopropylmalate synthase, partial [uncultured Acidimicrobiales bacterium]
RRALQPPARPPTAPLRRRPRLHVVLRVAPGRHQEGLHRPRGRRRARWLRGVAGAVPPHRPQARGPQLRSRHPGEQPVRQGRCRLHHEGRARPRPAPPPADRVLVHHPAHHRGHRDRDHARCDVGGVRGPVPAGRSSHTADLPRADRRSERDPDHRPAAGRRRDHDAGRAGERPDRRTGARHSGRPRGGDRRGRLPRARRQRRRRRHRRGLRRVRRPRRHEVGRRPRPQHPHCVPEGRGGGTAPPAL